MTVRHVPMTTREDAGEVMEALPAAPRVVVVRDLWAS